SLIVGLAGLALAGVSGSLIGLVAGYRGGVVDEALMALADIQLAFPNVLLAIAVIAVLGPSLFNLIMVLGFTGWVPYAPVARRSPDLVHRVPCLGAVLARGLCRHAPPHSASLLVGGPALHRARIILLEPPLRFLGLGVQPPTPSWGAMISEGRGYLNSAWWIA